MNSFIHTESPDNNFDGEQQIAIWNELYFNSLSILIPNNMIFCSTITIRALLGTSSQGCYVTLLGRCSRRYTKSRHERGVLLKSSWPCHFSCSLALLSDDLSCQMITMVYVCVFFVLLPYYVHHHPAQLTPKWDYKIPLKNFFLAAIYFNGSERCLCLMCVHLLTPYYIYLFDDKFIFKDTMGTHYRLMSNCDCLRPMRYSISHYLWNKTD